MTDHEAVLVAHGSPSEPLRQDEAMAALAAQVAALAPGWQVRGATLASRDSLAVAMDGLAAPLVYPFFMAEGWFTREVLPARLSAMSRPCRVLPAFGMESGLPALVQAAATSGAAAHGLVPARTTLLLAAHGSQVSPASRNRTLEIAAELRRTSSFADVTAGFIEEEPFLADVARRTGSGICLPLFTLRAGHVEEDVPRALAKSCFGGVLLPHIGAHAAVPALVAATLARRDRKAAA